MYSVKSRLRELVCTPIVHLHKVSIGLNAFRMVKMYCIWWMKSEKIKFLIFELFCWLRADSSSSVLLFNQKPETESHTQKSRRSLKKLCCTHCIRCVFYIFYVYDTVMVQTSTCSFWVYFFSMKKNFLFFSGFHPIIPAGKEQSTSVVFREHQFLASL